jgi:hypothetical protein
MPDEPKEVVAKASIDGDDGKATKGGQGRGPAVSRLYPRRTLEDALRVPRAIRENNGGNPWPPSEVAKALGVGGSTGSFYYLTAAARDFGLTEGTRDTEAISLTDLGRKAVYPGSEEAAAQAKLQAFNKVDLFKRVADHYGGSNLPQNEFLKNTLETTFGLDPRVHEEFIDLFKKNSRYAGIGAEITKVKVPLVPRAERANGSSKTDKADGSRPVCFVVMPFVERTDEYAIGFFTEVFAALFKPAVEAAGFTARTAQRQGSDVIQSTIIIELIEADLVLADLTEHNPNVLFELGVRIALEKPTALVRAQGTGAIFDVDNLLRVESYNPNLWPSTVPKDVEKLTEHVRAAWDNRESDMPFMRLLSQRVGAA